MSCPSNLLELLFNQTWFKHISHCICILLCGISCTVSFKLCTCFLCYYYAVPVLPFACYSFRSLGYLSCDL